MPVTLAIETSQRTGGVALRDGGSVLHRRTLPSHTRHDETLMPTIDALVRDVGLDPTSLELVGVSVGPGGFTGLRIAVTTAKLLADVLGVRLVAVPSALVVAGSIETSSLVELGLGNRVLIASAAKREVVWATQVRLGDVPTDAVPQHAIEGVPGLVSADEVNLEQIRGVVGDQFLPETLRRRCEACGVPVLEPRFDPKVLLLLSEDAASRDDVVDPLTLGPQYAREPEAVRLHRSRGGD